MVSYDARDDDYDYAEINRGMKTLRTKYGATLVRKLHSQWIVQMARTTPKRLRNYLKQFLGADYGIIINTVSLKGKSWSELGTLDKTV